MREGEDAINILLLVVNNKYQIIGIDFYDQLLLSSWNHQCPGDLMFLKPEIVHSNILE